MSGDELWIANFLSQGCQNRLQIKQLNRVAAVDHGSNRTHDQLKAIGKAVAGNFALVQFKLMKNSFQTFLADALLGHFLKRALNELFQIVLFLWFTALNTA